MKIAIISDIHDNETRLTEVLAICRNEGVKHAICCGDVGQIETLELLASGFEHLWLALGNADFSLKNKTGLFPENIEWNEGVLVTILDNLRIAVVHFDYRAKEIAKTGEFDFVFYGHTHTPWEKSIGKTTMLNPGEVAGQYGRATFAIFDTRRQRATLVPIT